MEEAPIFHVSKPAAFYNDALLPRLSNLTLLLLASTHRYLRNVIKEYMRSVWARRVGGDSPSRVIVRRDGRVSLSTWDIMRLFRDSLKLPLLLKCHPSRDGGIEWANEFVESVASEVSPSLLRYFTPSVVSFWWATVPDVAGAALVRRLAGRAEEEKELRLELAIAKCYPPVLRTRAASHGELGRATRVAWHLIAGDTSFLAREFRVDPILLTALAAVSGSVDALTTTADYLGTAPGIFGGWSLPVIVEAFLASDVMAAHVARNCKWSPVLIQSIFEFGREPDWHRLLRFLPATIAQAPLVLLPPFWMNWQKSHRQTANREEPLPNPCLPVLNWLGQQGFVTQTSVETVLRPLLEEAVPAGRGGPGRNCTCASHVLYGHLCAPPFSLKLGELAGVTQETKDRAMRILRTAGYNDAVAVRHRAPRIHEYEEVQDGALELVQAGDMDLERPHYE